jgi:chorismate mutase
VNKLGMYKSNEIEKIREKINEIDEKIISLISKRLSLMPEVAKIKIDNNLKVRQPEREKQLLKNIKKIAAEKNISPIFAEKIFSLLIEESCLAQEKTIGEHR